MVLKVWSPDRQPPRHLGSLGRRTSGLANKQQGALCRGDGWSGECSDRAEGIHIPKGLEPSVFELERDTAAPICLWMIWGAFHAAPAEWRPSERLYSLQSWKYLPGSPSPKFTDPWFSRWDWHYLVMEPRGEHKGSDIGQPSVLSGQGWDSLSVGCCLQWMFLNFFSSIVDLQYCVTLYTAKWFSCTYIYVLFQVLFHYGLP